jgi:hypothetical protein
MANLEEVQQELDEDNQVVFYRRSDNTIQVENHTASYELYSNSENNQFQRNPSFDHGSPSSSLKTVESVEPASME